MNFIVRYTQIKNDSFIFIGGIGETCQIFIDRMDYELFSLGILYASDISVRGKTPRAFLVRFNKRTKARVGHDLAILM